MIVNSFCTYLQHGSDLPSQAPGKRVKLVELPLPCQFLEGGRW